MNNKTKITKFENGFIEISDLDTMLHIKIKPGTSQKDVEESFEMARFVRQLISEMNPSSLTATSGCVNHKDDDEHQKTD